MVRRSTVPQRICPVYAALFPTSMAALPALLWASLINSTPGECCPPASRVLGEPYGQQLSWNGKHDGGGVAGFAGATAEGTADDGIAGPSVSSAGVSIWVSVSTVSRKIAPPRSAPRAHRVGMIDALRDPG